MRTLGRQIVYVDYLLWVIVAVGIAVAGLPEAYSQASRLKPLTLDGRLAEARKDIGSYTLFYEDASGDTLPLAIIETKPFLPFHEKRNERANPSPRTVMITWLQFTLRNTHSIDTLKLFHRAGQGHGRITTYEKREQGLVQLLAERGFDYLPRHEQADPFATFLILPPRAERTYYVRVMDYLWVYMPIISELVTPTHSWQAGFLEDRSFIPSDPDECAGGLPVVHDRVCFLPLPTEQGPGFFLL